MECDESLELLSELHAGTLEESTALLIRRHLADCPPCCGVYEDLQTIVLTATSLGKSNDQLEFPDENAIWQRITVRRRTTVH
ncbi:MAG: zf-HC2 domain-containing protein [Pyrinomonadaceae bacterium]|nr:zf-HC2 domain-containing protein [Pyrinomonadaceae bacterium]